MTRSASTGCSLASCIPIWRRASYRLRPSMYESGPGEVDELEHAQGRRRLRVADRDRVAARPRGRRSRRARRRARSSAPDDVERRGLRGEDPAAGVVAPQPGRAVVGRGHRQPPEDERPEPVRVADADHPLLVEDHEAERAPDARQDLAQGVDRVRGGLVGEERGQQLRVGAGGQAAAAALELVEQLAGVDEVAVVPDRERPPRPEAERRLGVLPDRGPGRRVAAVGDGEVAHERRDPPLVEHLADHAQVLVDHQLPAVGDADAGRLLAAVLEREQRGRGDGRGLVAVLGQDDPDDAAHQARHLRFRGARHRPRDRRLRRPPSRAPRQPVLPGVAQVRDRHVERVRDPAAPLLRGAGRAVAGELDDEPRAAGRAQGVDRAARAGGRAARTPGRGAGRTSTTSRDGLSPNSATAGESPTPTAQSRAPTSPQIAISASATARPPPDTSWQLSTRPRAIASRMNAWTARSRARSSGGGPSSGAAPASRSYSEPASPGAVSPTMSTALPVAAERRARRASRRRPAARRSRSRASGRSRSRAPRCTARRCRR